MQPIRRAGITDDIANTAVFLASDAAETGRATRQVSLGA